MRWQFYSLNLLILIRHLLIIVSDAVIISLSLSIYIYIYMYDEHIYRVSQEERT